MIPQRHSPSSSHSVQYLKCRRNVEHCLNRSLGHLHVTGGPTETRTGSRSRGPLGPRRATDPNDPCRYCPVAHQAAARRPAAACLDRQHKLLEIGSASSCQAWIRSDVMARAGPDPTIDAVSRFPSCRTLSRWRLVCTCSGSGLRLRYRTVLYSVLLMHRGTTTTTVTSGRPVWSHKR